MRWTQSGNQIAVGDDQGKISLFDVNETFANPRADDWTKFVRVLQDLKQSSVEMNESVNASASISLTSSAPQPGLNSINNSIVNNTPILPNVKSEPNFEYRSGFVSPPSITQAFMSQLKSSPQTPK